MCEECDAACSRDLGHEGGYMNRLRRNDRAMIRWICNVRAKDEVSSDSLLTKLGIQDLDVVLRTNRMRWFGHVERSTGWIAEVCKLNVVAQKRSGRPRKSWDEVLENDRKKLGMDSADPQNRSEWRGRLRGRLVKKPNPQGSKMDTMMMMMLLSRKGISWKQNDNLITQYEHE